MPRSARSKSNHALILAAAGVLVLPLSALAQSSGVGTSPTGNAVAVSPWPMFRHDLQHTGRSSFRGPATPTKKWQFSTRDTVESSPAIGADGTIYVGSFDNSIYAIRPDGTKKWEFPTGGWVNGSPAIGSDGTIYVGSYDNTLYALRPDGTRKWEFVTGQWVDSSPVIGTDGTVYVGSADARLYAIRPDGTKKWEIVTGGWVGSSPAIGPDATIYVGSSDGKLYAVRPDGSVRWVFVTDGLFVGSPAIGADGTIYVGLVEQHGGHGGLYAIRPDGSKKWEFVSAIGSAGSLGNSPVAIGTDGTIYLHTSDLSLGSDSRLFALRPDGTRKWEFVTGATGVYAAAPVIGADGTIFVASLVELQAVGPDGTKRWGIPASGLGGDSPSIGADGTIYVGGIDGLQAFGGASGVIQIAGPSTDAVAKYLEFTATAQGCTPAPFGWSWESDASLASLAPPFGGLVGAPSSMTLAWTSEGRHQLLVRNSGCPGVEGRKEVNIQSVALAQGFWLCSGESCWSSEAHPPQGVVHPAFPTIVFCHGWQPVGSPAACRDGEASCGKDLWSCVGSSCDSSSIDHGVGELLRDPGINKLQFIWGGGFKLLPSNASNNIEEAGHKLAEMVQAALGEGYSKSLQFVGHSFGGVVCGQAAKEYLSLSPNMRSAQLTVLDRPDRRGGGFSADYFPKLFKETLAARPDVDLVLDNYWSGTGVSFGGRTMCVEGALRTYNHAMLADPGEIAAHYFTHESRPWIDHSGVQQWYRWTMDPNGVAGEQVCSGQTFTPPSEAPVLGQSLNPCAAGWNVAIVRGANAIGGFPDSVCEPVTVTETPIVGSAAAGTSEERYARSGDLLVAAVEEGDGAQASSTTSVDIPASVTSLLFDLEVSKATSTQRGVVTLDNTIIWNGSFENFKAGVAREIGPLSVVGLTGRRTLALKALGTGNGTIRLRNLRGQKVLVPCEASDALCLAAHRFRVQADWTDHEGNSGYATPRYVGADDSGFMWFFAASNLELIVKVLNGCALGDRFWVFAAGLTNVGVRLTVTDTVTGAVQMYVNPEGRAFSPIQDTDAFATCRPADRLAPAAAQHRTEGRPYASSSAGVVGLSQGRFEVSASWRTPAGATGTGHFVPVTDDSGYLWFFDPSNIEMIVKVLDGCGLNNRFWVFSAGLTNVEVRLRLVDTSTGQVKEYANPLGVAFQPIQDVDAFASCP